MKGHLLHYIVTALYFITLFLYIVLEKLKGISMTNFFFDVLAGISNTEIEDITWPRGDVKFLFEC